MPEGMGTPPGPVDAVPPADSGAIPVAPSAFEQPKKGDGPTVAFAQYNPRTGEYVGSDGKLYTRATKAAETSLDKTWKDLLLTE